MAKSAPAVYDPVDDLVICYDGTWCGDATGTTGNMKILADIFACHGKPKDWKGLQKKDGVYEERLMLGCKRDVLVRYFEGPGIDGSLAEYLINGALALDIKKHTVDAYETIVQHYKEGTRVWLFGLSRGAYLVRSVAGIINNVGILDISGETAAQAKDLRVRLDGLYDIYRSPDPKNHPNKPWATSFRATQSWPMDKDKGPIYLMGLLDTVGALGLPMVNAGGQLGYGLYDQMVSSVVQRCYQALSLTDRLAPFEPCFIRRADENKHLPCEEVWFPGAHYDIGRQKFQLLRKFVEDDKDMKEHKRNILTRLLGIVGRGAEATVRWLLSVNFEVDYTPALSNPPLLYLLRRIQQSDKTTPSVLPADVLSRGQAYIDRFAKDDNPTACQGPLYFTIDAYGQIVKRLGEHTLGGVLSGLITTFVKSQVLASRQVPQYDSNTRRFFYGGDTLQHRPDKTTPTPYRSKSLRTWCALKGYNPTALPPELLYREDLPAAGQ